MITDDGKIVIVQYIPNVIETRFINVSVRDEKLPLIKTNYKIIIIII
jgi:hypothetical protein